MGTIELNLAWRLVNLSALVADWQCPGVDIISFHSSLTYEWDFYYQKLYLLVQTQGYFCLLGTSKAPEVVAAANGVDNTESYINQLN